MFIPLHNILSTNFPYKNTKYQTPPTLSKPLIPKKIIYLKVEYRSMMIIFLVAFPDCWLLVIMSYCSEGRY